MTDPIPAEAVEAAARALYLHEHGTYVFANEAWLAGMEGNEKWQERALVALTAAAPYIAADLRASRDEWASRMMEFAETQRALTDLRDIWRRSEAASRETAHAHPVRSVGALLHSAIAELCKTHADALDALLRGA